MKVQFWSRRVELTNRDAPGPEDGDRLTGTHHLTVADKAAFVLLAVGLLALGGVLFAAGLAVLLALAAAGTVIGGAAVIRYKLFGPSHPHLRPGEIEANADVISTPTPPTPTPPDRLRDPDRPTRGD